MWISSEVQRITLQKNFLKIDSNGFIKITGFNKQFIAFHFSIYPLPHNRRYYGNNSFIFCYA